MLKKLSALSNNKSSLFLLTLALIVGGIGAQASGMLKSPSGGYLVCVHSSTKVVTHPGTSICPKGSKKLVLGAQGEAGTDGLTGAAGLPGKDGVNGKDGNTLWNGTTDPISTLGAPGDMFINSQTKTMFGPKNLDGTWPAGVSMVGPAGPTGAQGPGGGSGPSGPAGATGSAGVAAPVVTGSNCIGLKCTYKIGDIGPGGGLIFFVDYNDIYPSLNYLEAAPYSCEALRKWASDFIEVPAVSGWNSRGVGRGYANTIAIVESDTAGTVLNNAAKFARSCNAGEKTDWFLGSIGEMMLMYENLIGGAGEFSLSTYWSSSESDRERGFYQNFSIGGQGNGGGKHFSMFVRPIRTF